MNPEAQKKLAERVPQNTQLEKTYQNLFSMRTKDLFEQTWKLHFEAENAIELLRVKLLANPYFDLNKTFYEDLDVDGDGYVNSQDITQFLRANDINTDPTTEELVFARYNKRANPDKINYSEFIEEITPRAQHLSSRRS